MMGISVSLQEASTPLPCNKVPFATPPEIAVVSPCNRQAYDGSKWDAGQTAKDTKTCIHILFS